MDRAPRLPIRVIRAIRGLKNFRMSRTCLMSTLRSRGSGRAGSSLTKSAPSPLRLCASAMN